VDAESTSTGGKFPRRLFGYSRHEVDSHLDQGARAYQAACREIDRLRAAEPLTRVGADVAALISSFAETVGTMREAAKREAGEVRDEADTYATATREAADAYAATQRSDADRVYESAVLRARAESSAMLHAARAEIAGLLEQRQQIERSLREAADGITNAMRAISRVGGLAEPAMPRGPSPAAIPAPPPDPEGRPDRAVAPVGIAVRPDRPNPPRDPAGLVVGPPAPGEPGRAASVEPMRPVARTETPAGLVVDSPGTSTVAHLTAKTP